VWIEDEADLLVEVRQRADFWNGGKLESWFLNNYSDIWPEGRPSWDADGLPEAAVEQENQNSDSDVSESVPVAELVDTDSELSPSANNNTDLLVDVPSDVRAADIDVSGCQPWMEVDKPSPISSPNTFECYKEQMEDCGALSDIDEEGQASPPTTEENKATWEDWGRVSQAHIVSEHYSTRRRRQGRDMYQPGWENVVKLTQEKSAAEKKKKRRRTSSVLHY
jgi:hypothetical protein